MSRTALIIGASSGIGLEIARLLSARGYRLGIAARRGDLLQAHAASDPNIAAWKILDLDAEDALPLFTEMATQLGVVDEVYLSAGTGFLNPKLDWPPEHDTIQTNATGFARLAGAAIRLFEAQGHGHLVGITSMAALRGSGEAPAYGASKAFASRYLQGLRFRARQSKLPIYVTDIRPGFVDTAMMKAESPFWVASPQKAAIQIVRAVEKKRGIAYITRRWTILGWLLKHLPE